MTSRRTYLIVVGALASIILTLSAVGKSRIARPAAGDFGPGPRTSAQGLYVATLQGVTDLKPRKMYTLQATVVDGKSGQPVTGASITVDGGMPQHGHGLPTRPRARRTAPNATTARSSA